MFNNIASFINGSNFLSNVLDNFKDMLEKAESMYERVTNTLLQGVENTQLKKSLYETDKEINTLEKEIRKRIVEHLALQPTIDMSTCLVLMSVVKDAERLGDYCKNLYEVIDLTDKPIDKERYTTLFNGLDEELRTLFHDTKKAFINSDTDVALSSWEHKAKISQRCDDIVEKLAHCDLTVNEAVCFTLMARHFKRLSSHLVNIATSVILPVDKLDYYDEKTDEI